MMPCPTIGLLGLLPSGHPTRRSLRSSNCFDAGTFTIEANYPGDLYHEASSRTVKQVVK